MLKGVLQIFIAFLTGSLMLIEMLQEFPPPWIVLSASKLNWVAILFLPYCIYFFCTRSDTFISAATAINGIVLLAFILYIPYYAGHALCSEAYDTLSTCYERVGSEGESQKDLSIYMD